MDNKKEIVTQWLIDKGHNYCSMPYTHMAIESNGDVRPCCVGEPFKDLNITDHSIGETFNHPIRQKFVETFNNGQKSSLCNACWKDKTKFSNRVKFSTMPESLEQTYNAMQGNAEGRAQQLKWLEIKPGNRCNLKCRICGVHNSSQWTKDSYEYDIHVNNKQIQFKESSQFKYTASCDWIDQDGFWQDITNFKSISTIHFMGGEPFMVPEHFKMLQAIIDSDIDPNNIVLRYNTNGTYFPTLNQLKIWRKFKKVKLSLSIDDIQARFEYQRKLADWNQVRENLKKFCRLKSHYAKNGSNVEPTLDPCVSIFNIWYLDEIEKEFNYLGYTISNTQSHFVTSNGYDAKVLPNQIKDKLIKKYENSTAWQHNVAQFLKTRNPHKRTALKEAMYEIEFYDRLRNEKFQKLNNELYNELRKHNNGIFT